MFLNGKCPYNEREPTSCEKKGKFKDEELSAMFEYKKNDTVNCKKYLFGYV